MFQKSKIITLFLLIILLPNYLFSQNYNLVPNSSFEFNTDNLYLINDTDFSTNNYCWIKANDEAPNYGKVIDTGVTYPFYPYPNEGVSYIKLSFKNPKMNIISKQILDSISCYRTYAQTKLLKPLQAGIKYYLSLLVGNTKFKNTDPNLGYYNILVNNLGVYFSNNKIGEFSNPNRINFNPQINFTGWSYNKFDTFTYTILKGEYIAIGGEQYMTIGNFDYYKDTYLDYVRPGLILPDSMTLNYNSYLFIDDITLVSDTTIPIIPLNKFSLGNDTIICDGSQIKIGGQSNFFHYLWNTGDTTQFIEINQSGTYWCRIDFGCSYYTDTIKVTYLSNSFSSFLPKDTTICANEKMEINAPTNYKYVWSTGDTTQQIILSNPNTYWCNISNLCGSLTDTFTLKTNQCDIWFPNAFSPNKDGLNDDFKPLGKTEYLINYYIYNRFGNCIFNNDNAVFGWDGKYKSMECPIGTYYYFCRYKYNNITKTIKGSLELIR